MATQIKRIEKDFLIKALYDNRITVIYNKGQTQYNLLVERPADTEEGQLFFKLDKTIDELKAKDRLDLMFDYCGQVITFFVEVVSVDKKQIVTTKPEFLHKNLDRSFSRVSAPPDLQVEFTFLDDRYSLSYPKINEYEPEGQGELVKTMNPKNLSGLVRQMEEWIKGFASGYKMVVFKDVKPNTVEERLLAETGKSLYLPLIQKGFPLEDPYPRKRLVTLDIFRRFLENSGVERHKVNDTCARFIKQKHDKGFISELWVPILFQEYVIGYIRAWVDKEEIPPFDYTVIDNIHQFSKILAHSLRINRFFDSGKIKGYPFEGRIIDISVSGLLFSYPISALTTTLVPESELSVELKALSRTVSTKVKIVRNFKDRIREYFGCNFLKMQPEDIRFLFEYLYGKPFTDEDAAFLAGHV